MKPLHRLQEKGDQREKHRTYRHRRPRNRRHRHRRFLIYSASPLADSAHQRKAEAELAARQERVSKLEIRELTQEEQVRFSDAWRKTQADFVDDPSRAVNEANDLVKEVMRARGYPVGDFEQRAADVSVDHASVVSNYRAAYDIATRNKSSEATTEDLRQAMVHYRSLFEELLAQPSTRKEAAA